jgi:hypothetical protein
MLDGSLSKVESFFELKLMRESMSYERELDVIQRLDIVTGEGDRGIDDSAYACGMERNE